MDALFGNLFSTYQIEELDRDNNINNRQNQAIRRSSQMMMMMNNYGSIVNQNDPLPLSTSGMDAIRINLPEILDQQDEITILRLLIKLLSNKVNKLNEEKRRLLENVSILSGINAEMAAIIEQGYQK